MFGNSTPSFCHSENSVLSKGNLENFLFYKLGEYCYYNLGVNIDVYDNTCVCFCLDFEVEALKWHLQVVLYCYSLCSVPHGCSGAQTVKPIYKCHHDKLHSASLKELSLPELTESLYSESHRNHTHGLPLQI